MLGWKKSMEKIDLIIRFAPKSSSEEHKYMAKAYLALADIINNTDMEPREKVIAIERLEESYMWTLKGFNNVI